jgi:hypothetical protein
MRQLRLLTAAAFAFVLFALVAHTPVRRTPHPATHGGRASLDVQLHMASHGDSIEHRAATTVGRDHNRVTTLRHDIVPASVPPSEPTLPSAPTRGTLVRAKQLPPAVRPSAPPPPGWGTFILIPRLPADDSPACIDGSPFGFHYRLSASGSTKWTFTLPGGGWCHDEQSCAEWTSHSLGSSKSWGKEGTGQGKGTAWGESPQGHRCEELDQNCVYLKYCDGGAFGGARPGTVDLAVAGQGNVSLYFRGLHNFDAVVAWALQNGLNRATEAVLTGISAGGVATLVHVDRLAARVPVGCKVRALAIDGFFIARPNRHGAPSPFSADMARMMDMMHITGGLGGALPEACIKDHPAAPHKCLLPAVLQQYIATPFFLMQTKFDQWQLANVVGLGWSNCIISNHRPECNTSETAEQQPLVRQFGRDLLADLAPVVSSALARGNGGFVSSCICHYRCPYGNLSLPRGGPSGSALFAAWLRGDPDTAGRFVIDNSLAPNGDGALLALPKSGLAPLYAQPCTPADTHT